MGGTKFPPYPPPCSFRVIANLGNDWEIGLYNKFPE